jgi:hypothetical protein
MAYFSPVNKGSIRISKPTWWALYHEKSATSGFGLLQANFPSLQASRHVRQPDEMPRVPELRQPEK